MNKWVDIHLDSDIQRIMKITELSIQMLQLRIITLRVRDINVIDLVNSPIEYDEFKRMNKCAFVELSKDPFEQFESLLMKGPNQNITVEEYVET